MSALQAIIIAILQGATELFPVSSLGHAVVLPALLHWPIDQHSPEFLPFLVMLHLGTATALLLYILARLVVAGDRRAWAGSPHQVSESRRVFMLIVVATIPAVIVGFLLEKFVRGLFGTPIVAAVFLMVNGAAAARRREVARPRPPAAVRPDRDGRAHHRLMAVHRTDPRHLSLRRHHRRRPVARHRP